MSKVVALTSQKAAKSAQKLAQRIQEVCTGEDMTIVTCALMAVVSTLPADLAATVVAGIVRQTNEGGHGQG